MQKTVQALLSVVELPGGRKGAGQPAGAGTVTPERWSKFAVQKRGLAELIPS